MKKYLSLILVLLAVFLLSACGGENHELIKTEAKAPDCVSDGHTEYYTCVSCSKVFADAEGQQEISVFDTFLSKLGHRPDTDDGTCLTEQKCTRCGEVLQEAQSAHTAAEVTDCTVDTTCKFCPTVMIPARESHEGGTATCLSPALCDHCGTPHGEIDPENHDKAPSYTFDNILHSGSYPCCGVVIEDMVGHEFIEGFCTCGIRQAHHNTLSISDLPGADSIIGWKAGDELLLTVESELFGVQNVTVTYDEDGTWVVTGDAFWAPGETVTATAWFAPGYTLSEEGVLTPKPDAMAGAGEYLLAACAIDADNLLTVDFASSVRSYSVFSVTTAPNTVIDIELFHFAPAGVEGSLDGAYITLTTDANGTAWFFGTFHAGGSYTVANANGDTLLEQTFSAPTAPGQYYQK